MRYEEILVAIRAVVDKDAGVVANMANVAALLMEYVPDINWAGFYLLRGDELILGPFCGKVACVRIKKGQGVCGTAVLHNRTYLVPDVHAFPGHIACDAASQSEIVVPLRDEAGAPIGVLDVDSKTRGRLALPDAMGLEMIAEYVQTLFWKEAE